MLEGFCAEREAESVFEPATGVKSFIWHPLVGYDNGRSKSPTGAARIGCGYECLEWLLSGYDFIESDVRFPDDRLKAAGVKYHLLSVEGGKYRYHLIERPDPRCERFDILVRRGGSYRSIVEKYEDELGDRCVVDTPIGTFASRYVYEHYAEFVRPSYLLENQILRIGGYRAIDSLNGKEIGLSSYVHYRDYRFSPIIKLACKNSKDLPVRSILQPF